MIRHFFLLVVFTLFVSGCDAGCSEVDSLTEAVAGEGFLLGCISCKKREEVLARATVDWHFKPQGEKKEENEEGEVKMEKMEMEKEEKVEFKHIFHYEHPNAYVLHEDFIDRLEWHGTMRMDIQIASIYVHNINFNDTGTYRCTIHRTLLLPQHNEHVTVEKEVELDVVSVANRELTSVISEIMMYVLIVVLQLWLIVVLVYCYKKISNEHEAREARKALKAQEALLESKENCDGVQLE